MALWSTYLFSSSIPTGQRNIAMIVARIRYITTLMINVTPTMDKLPRIGLE